MEPKAKRPTLGKENAPANINSATNSKRRSERLANKPKTGLTIEEQATQLLIKKSGVLDMEMESTQTAKEKFITQFTAPLMNPTVGGFRDCFGLPEAGDSDALNAVAIDAEC